MKKLKYFLFILVNFSIFAQPVFVNVGNPVYSFLDKLSVKGVIDYSSLVLPKTRTEIRDHLLKLNEHTDLLSNNEKEDLAFFLDEYDTSQKRWHLYSYRDSLFNFTVDPQAGVKLNFIYKESQITRWTGVNFYSSFSDNWGFQMNYRDHSEMGKKIDRLKLFNPEPGIQILGGTWDNIEYSEMQGALTYQNKYITLSAGKGWFNWGSGYNGQLILSQKAPSFPHIRIDFHPAEWINFYYVHGWLNSRVRDSVNSYATPLIQPDSTNPQYRIIERDKFYSSHILEFIPWRKLRVAIGESIVYSDQDKPGYIIPIMFYRLADHYYEGQGGFGKGGNSQFFMDINWHCTDFAKVYTTLFIDEFSLTNFLKGKSDRNQTGFTIGGAVYNILPDVMFRAEYTRILPWVYSNFIQTQTYTNSNYLLGHYIGQNADQLFAEVSVSLLRRMEVKLWGEFTRRGGTGNIKYQYNPPGEDFLYGLKRKDARIGLELSYEYTHDLFGKIAYEYANISDEDPLRTDPWQLGANHGFSIQLQYGL